MNRSAKWLLVLVLAATSALAVMAGAASASRFEVSRREIRMLWSEMRFTTLSGERVACGVTLEGELESLSFTKVANLRIGRIIAAASSCPRTIVFLTETNWELLYEAFTGTLPNITSLKVKIGGFAFRWVGTVFNCLYRSEVPVNGTRNAETRQITRVEFSTNRIPPTGLLCRNATEEVSLSGVGIITKRGEGEGIFLYLI